MYEILVLEVRVVRKLYDPDSLNVLEVQDYENYNIF